MIPLLRITRIPYEEPYHVRLYVEACNGRQRGELEIYDAADSLGEVAARLHGFPKQPDDTVLWELGSERPEDNFAFYFRFRVFQVSAGGLCAIEFRFNNNRRAPHREISEFCMEAQPAELDRLADLFTAFAGLQHRVLEWNQTEGALYQDA